MCMEKGEKKQKQLEREIQMLRQQLAEAQETIEAIRTGQVDALIVEGDDGHQLFTLKTADHLYRIFIEKMAEGAVTLSREGLILYCNSQMAALVEQPLSKLIGAPFQTLISGKDRADYEALFQKSWNEDGKMEASLQGSGKEIPVLLSLSRMDLEDVPTLSVIVTDLTKQKNIQQELEKNNRALAQINADLEASNHDLQQFASVASHDLQEPLRKIQIFSHLLHERQAGHWEDGAERYLDKVTEASARMKTLIVDVLNYSRLSVHLTQWELVDLNTVVRSILNDFELVIAEKGAEITVDALPTLEANRGQMRQMFQNILSNALKFTNKEVPPRIQISFQPLLEKSFQSAIGQEGPYCLFRIKDNGIGFDEKYVSHIFALFERLHTKDQYEGTGIGLAITKKIVEKHHGLIRAESTSGQGAEFLIILPLKQATTP